MDKIEVPRFLLAHPIVIQMVQFINVNKIHRCKYRMHNVEERLAY